MVWLTNRLQVAEYTPLWVRGVLDHPAARKAFKPNALTYACIASFVIYFGYNIPRVLWHTRDPEPVASDFKKYDRATKKYVE